MRDGDVSHAPFSQLLHVLTDFPLVATEVKPSLDGMYQHLFLILQRLREFTWGASDHRVVRVKVYEHARTKTVLVRRTLYPQPCDVNCSNRTVE
jgi:hypothetical protein